MHKEIKKVADEIVALNMTHTNLDPSNEAEVNALISNMARQLRARGQFMIELGKLLEQNKEAVKQDKDLDDKLSALLLLTISGWDGIAKAANFINKETAENN